MDELQALVENVFKTKQEVHPPQDDIHDETGGSGPLHWIAKTTLMMTIWRLQLLGQVHPLSIQAMGFTTIVL